MNYKFSNLIDKKEYEALTQEDKEVFLVKNNIYIKLEVKLSEEEIKKRLEHYGNKLEAFNYLNDAVYDEIIDAYLANSNIYLVDISDEVKKINVYLENAIDKEDQETILRKYHKKYLKKIHKIDFATYYFLDKQNKKKFTSTDIRFIVKNNIGKDFVMNYIYDKKIYFEDEDIFNQWTKVAKYDKIISFIKNELTRISNTSNNKKPESKIITDYNFQIFKNKKAESLFYEILNSFNAIDKNQKAIDEIFKPVCASIFTSDDSSVIFTKGLIRVDYMKFLKQKFDSNINIQKGKLSFSKRYNDGVDKLLSKYSG